ncbi:putative cral trio domain-containing protein [Phaeoacremonium minimum UCRPA7]|uniref:Putative cral trio domain-containing protein n=1 Tax=Phaeoacremonium minimum (strain UCR-PA7) TaxID=1286976 RepID=R8BSE8_PHAM7|nr:putative cral trio domain-containing protein [Phaeoacremonium minimum UCRPA7]EOO02249.1 putative cral trio domain-containing protein [Phaeoacremonium minimum UCRPA7]
MATVAPPDSGASSSVQEKTSGPLKTPIPFPVAESKPKERATLTADQKSKYDWLLEQVKGWKEIPSDKGKTGPLADNEKMWLTRECLLRYLRATKWHQKEAEKRLKETVSWRRDYGVEELTPEHISPENETGKQVILGYDKQGRVCHYLNPGRQNTDPSPRQVQHLVFMVERVIELMPAQQETLALLINFKTSKSRTNTAPGISTGREVLHILQTHYPERLGRALIINVPWVVWGFFKLITPFIDPLTREKLKFNEDMRQYVPTEQLWTEFHGDLEFEYEHSVYWPALQKLCQERREEKKKRWEAGGKQIGEHEDYLTGHDEFGVAGAPAKVEEKLEQLKIADVTPAAANSESEEVKSEETKPQEVKAEEAKATEPSAGDIQETKPTEGDEAQKSA